MKTYVLTVSRTFPKNHSKAGKDTLFVDFIINAEKKHSIRANYKLWKKRIYEVLAGRAILSLRYWSGKPYASKQIEFISFDQYSNVAIQKLEFLSGDFWDPKIQDKSISLQLLAKNDCLSFTDFQEWFKKYDLSKPMAIIHFTDFRY